ncbi:unnamed protein product [Amoebophrya sp. A25]|nr:unnamed protein product [Amoebophrya sp. A25]|eukprot:GSA25T00007097001.1
MPLPGFLGFLRKFDPSACKAQLRMAAGRAKIQKSRTIAATKNLQKEVALLLKDGQESRAKIKAEQILQNINLCDALDLLDTMSELLLTRIHFIAEQKECPPDLVETVQTILYAASRCHVEELQKVVDQFQAKYGAEFVNIAKKDEKGLVHQRMVKLLSVRPPTPAEIVSILKDAATFYRVENWDSIGLEEWAEDMRKQEEARAQAPHMNTFSGVPTIGGPGGQAGGQASQQMGMGVPKMKPSMMEPEVTMIQHQISGLNFDMAAAQAQPHPQQPTMQPVAPVVQQQPTSFSSPAASVQQLPQPTSSFASSTGSSSSSNLSQSTNSGINALISVPSSTVTSFPASPLLSNVQNQLAYHAESTEPFVMATVPQGYGPGMTLLVRTPCGRTLSVILPEMTQPGQTIQIPIPRQEIITASQVEEKTHQTTTTTAAYSSTTAGAATTGANRSLLVPEFGTAPQAGGIHSNLGSIGPDYPEAVGGTLLTADNGFVNFSFGSNGNGAHSHRNVPVVPTPSFAGLVGSGDNKNLMNPSSCAPTPMFGSPCITASSDIMDGQEKQPDNLASLLAANCKEVQEQQEQANQMKGPAEASPGGEIAVVRPQEPLDVGVVNKVETSQASTKVVNRVENDASAVGVGGDSDDLDDLMRRFKALQED